MVEICLNIITILMVSTLQLGQCVGISSFVSQISLPTPLRVIGNSKEGGGISKA